MLDEPTAGLHPSDIDKLIATFDALVEAGGTVVVIEHNMAVAAAADHVIDMGPGAGPEGGTVVAQGPPEKIRRSKASKTAAFLGEKPFSRAKSNPRATTSASKGIRIQGANRTQP